MQLIDLCCTDALCTRFSLSPDELVARRLTEASTQAVELQEQAQAEADELKTRASQDATSLLEATRTQIEELTKEAVERSERLDRKEDELNL